LPADRASRGPGEPRIYKVFVASPGDVTAEREIVWDVMESLNDMLRARHVALEPIGWETHTAPRVGRDPQTEVLAHIRPEDCDIFLGILWSRLGTETPRAASGTVEEFQLAHASFLEHGQPRIMFYFSKVPLVPRLEDLPQLEAALRFQADVSRKGLVAQYRDTAEFARLVLQHIYLAVEQLEEDNDVSAALGQSSEEEADRGRATTDMVELRLKLEAKMAWVCKHLLAGTDTPTFATIGSLHYDKLLTDEQARVATRILSRDPTLWTGRLPEDLARTLKAESAFVRTFRANVFAGLVKETVRKAKWRVEPLADAPGRRRQFYAQRQSAHLRIAPLFALDPDGDLLARTRGRLVAPDDEEQPLDARLIVVPDKARIATAADEQPGVVRFEHLVDTLKRLRRASDVTAPSTGRRRR
jgi:hypothetical protein